MSDARLRGANKEITGAPDNCKNDKSSEINVDLIDKLAFSSLWFFDGVQDTPYEGGHIAVDAEVSRYYMTSHSSLEDTARYWTHVYAGGPAPPSGKGASLADVFDSNNRNLMPFRVFNCVPDHNHPRRQHGNSDRAIVSFRGLHGWG
ncbi:hypothetical protein DFH94DRAFT_678765 [Russula ochroleuca]|uniref:Uncharacterized protein n=1 Tax=Russula ochroleuca TaxID=152965 RepID=A0A9P5N4A0_9AGAM|nr:hypothetical protein DFH94DRAFT_678765 [Russula ochroleuca]